MPKYSPILKIMTDAVRKSAKIIVRDYYEINELQISTKGPNNFVSAADLKSEQIIVDELQRYYPDYSLLLEESGYIANKNKQWILDPIDGTYNFILSNPFFCISLALAKINDDGESEIIAGVIQAPILEETFYAEKGKGAFIELRNNQSNRIRVSKRKDLTDCLLTTGSYVKIDSELAEIKNLLSTVSTVRISGSSALDLAYIACGRSDIYLYKGLNPWDYAAASLIIKESGGVISDFSGAPVNLGSKSILAANEIMQFKAAQSIKNNKSAA